MDSDLKSFEIGVDRFFKKCFKFLEIMLYNIYIIIYILLITIITLFTLVDILIKKIFIGFFGI